MIKRKEVGRDDILDWCGDFNRNLYDCDSGLSILTGFTGLFSMGHAGFMAIGAYTSALLTKTLGCRFWRESLWGCWQHWPLDF